MRPTADPAPATGAVSPRLSQAHEELHAQMRATAAGACAPGSGPVLGTGNPHAALMLVGEAPGEREVVEDRPFAGPAGKLLDQTLCQHGVDRAELWISNAVKCRPTRELPTGRNTNRSPSVAETKLWTPLLFEEIALVNPKLLVCLGAVAARALLGPEFRLTEGRGVWRIGPSDTRVLATFHPAYILHLQSHAPDASRRAAAQFSDDIGKAAERLRTIEKH